MINLKKNLEIECPNVFSGTLSAGETEYEDVTIDMTGKSGFTGYFSVQPVFSGSGTLKISYEVSNNGVVWSPAVEIIAGAVSGTVYPFPAAGANNFAGYQRLVFEETGTASDVIISGVYRCIQ